MTITEVTTEAVEVADDVGREVTPLPELPPPPPRGAAGVVGAVDHKTVGRLFIGVGLLGGAAALVLSLLVSVEGLALDSFDVLADNTYFQVYNLALVAGFFFFALPTLLGLAMYIVPLQVGSRQIAFPRAAAASFWGWLVGVGITAAAWGIDGGPGGSDGDAIALSLSGLGLTILSLLLATVCVVTTVASLRTEGMTLTRVPAFSWAMFVAGSVWMLTLPVLLANISLLYLDTKFGNGSLSGPAELWIQLRWIFGQPAVFMFAVPVLGLAVDAITTLAGRPQKLHAVVLGLIGAAGVLSFGAFVQPAYNARVVQQGVYVGMALLLVLPMVGLLGGMGDTLRRGIDRAGSPLGLGLLSLLLLEGTAVAGAAHAIEPLNLQGTMWGLGIAKLILGVALMGAATGIHYWGRKIWGRQPAEPIGKLNTLLLAGGVALFGGADLVSGALGQRSVDFSGTAELPDQIEDGAELLNGASALGAAMLLGGIGLLLLAALPGIMRSREPAEDDEYDDGDPWRGHTLEWATLSPPPHGNFRHVLAPVTSAAPLNDLREAGEEVHI